MRLYIVQEAMMVNDVVERISDIYEVLDNNKEYHQALVLKMESMVTN